MRVFPAMEEQGRGMVMAVHDQVPAGLLVVEDRNLVGRSGFLSIVTVPQLVKDLLDLFLVYYILRGPELREPDLFLLCL